MPAKLIQVIATEERRGQGTLCDPVRMVQQFYSTDGELLLEHDTAKTEVDASISRRAYGTVVVMLERLKMKVGRNEAIVSSELTACLERVRAILEGRL